MAIVQTMWLKGSKKRLGGAVLYQSAGRTLARELAADVANPRTTLQMKQRVKWANLVAFYRANRSWMRKAFESKKAYQSDYNKLMQLNVAASGIYLTKQQAAQGACVVGAYRISEGSLPSVEIVPSELGWASNLYISPNFVGTTVGEWAASLLAYNPGLRSGDQLSFIRVTQSTNPVSGVPYLQVRPYEVLLDPTSAEPFANYMPTDLVVARTDAGVGRVCVDDNGNSGAFAFVISRTISGRTTVSTQQLTLVNMDELLATYTSSEQLQAAIDSYGTTSEIFLDSNAAGTGPVESLTLSLLSLQIGDEFLAAGAPSVPATDWNGKRFVGLFNMAIPEPIDAIWMDTEVRSIPLLPFRRVGSQVIIDAMGQHIADDGMIKQVRIIMSGKTFVFPFTLE